MPCFQKSRGKEINVLPKCHYRASITQSNEYLGEAFGKNNRFYLFIIVSDFFCIQFLIHLIFNSAQAMPSLTKLNYVLKNP